jgi:16S rRNA (uracil1498-N3)-methyltransferase
MEGARDYELKLIASLQPGAQPLHAVLERFRQARGRPPRTALWLIGPEGDFTPAELSLARSCGFEGVTLGPLVLRCETAAIFALSVLGYELGRNP